MDYERTIKKDLRNVVILESKDGKCERFVPEFVTPKDPKNTAKITMKRTANKNSLVAKETPKRSVKKKSPAKKTPKRYVKKNSPVAAAKTKASARQKKKEEANMPLTIRQCTVKLKKLSKDEIDEAINSKRHKLKVVSSNSLVRVTNAHQENSNENGEKIEEVKNPNRNVVLSKSLVLVTNAHQGNLIRMPLEQNNNTFTQFEEPNNWFDGDDVIKIQMPAQNVTLIFAREVFFVMIAAIVWLLTALFYVIFLNSNIGRADITEIDLDCPSAIDLGQKKNAHFEF